MSEKKTYKICIVGNSFSRGGSERAHSNLSFFFGQKGLTVHNVIFEDLFGYGYFGELYNLGKFSKKNFIDKIIRYKKLYDYIKKHKFDYIIDLRYRGTFYAEYLLSKLVFGQTKYIPSIRGYRLYGYFTKNEFTAKRIYKNAYAIVTVSKEIEKESKKRYGYNNLKTIYNILDLERIENLSKENILPEINTPFIVGLGRMAENNIKQHDVMIKAFHKSKLPESGIKLVLIGDGFRRAEFENLSKELQLEDKVIFTGFKENPFPYLKKSFFMLLTSKNEGFPNVILESFACQTPVISYDCKSGPNEVIIDKQNGLLVENQNIDELVKAMNLMIEDEDLYQTCKSNTLKTALQFSPEIIGQQWLDLMNIKL